MKDNIQTVIIVSRDALFSAACARELQALIGAVRVETVISPGEAHSLAQMAPPDVIVLDETALGNSTTSRPPVENDLESVATRLAAIAPLIVLASPESHSRLAALIAVDATDFVARSGEFRPVALSLLERRLRAPVRAAPAAPSSETLFLELRDDFGEVLRHELNNPLTGILGNAELLLAEMRRRQDGRLPQGAQRRLEIITDLAVRLRETVRQLSEQWEARHDHARSA